MRPIKELTGSIIGSRIRVTDETRKLLIEDQLFGFEAEADRVSTGTIMEPNTYSPGRTHYTLKFAQANRVTVSGNALWEVVL